MVKTKWLAKFLQWGLKYSRYDFWKHSESDNFSASNRMASSNVQTILFWMPSWIFHSYSGPLIEWPEDRWGFVMFRFFSQFGSRMVW
jgi:hypothetical protein